MSRQRLVSKPRAGFTFVELMVSGVLLAIAITALLGAFLGQTTLNEHARNLTWAMNDANRVLERIRHLNTGCLSSPSMNPGPINPDCPPATMIDQACWNTWLADTSAGGGGGQSIQPNPAANELVIVTCQNRTGTAACAPGNDPVRVTIAVCWRHRGRTIGECTWTGTQLTASDGGNGFATNGAIESPAMLSTLMTCRT